MKIFEISTKKKNPMALVYGPRREGNPLASDFNLLPPIPGDLTIKSKSGTQWWDQLYNPGYSEILVFSKEVVDAVTTASLTGVEFYPLHLQEIAAKKLKREEAPSYYWARVSASLPATIIYADNGTEVEKHENSEVYDLQTTFGRRKKIRFEKKTETAPDFFFGCNTYLASRFCSQQFVDLVESKDWTNFNFGKQDEDGWLNL